MVDIERIKCHWDHPRACGENVNGGNIMPKYYGSPPRVRGKPRLLLRLVGHTRITPARAGKTNDLFYRPGMVEDHPRACGENPSRSLGISAHSGSPPRVRGKQTDQMPALRRIGITPARAGKTSFRQVKPFRNKDHPRACGENPHDPLPCLVGQGSPPRVRGKLPDDRVIRRGRRITPARAGKTAVCCRNRAASTDHPRACGENAPAWPCTRG